MDTITYVNVNGEDAEVGCWVDGHWGQYGPDRLEIIAEVLGLTLTEDERPTTWRRIAENATDHTEQQRAWDSYYAEAELILYRLNQVTEGGYWSWIDGELFLSADDDESNDF